MSSVSSKSKLRKIMADAVCQMSEIDKREQSAIVATKLFEHPRYKQAKTLSLYLSTRNEIDTNEILHKALVVDRKSCYIPIITDQNTVATGATVTGTRMTMIRLKSMIDYENLPLNKWGIKEPHLNSLTNQNQADPTINPLDLMLVPGVAFSSDGRRLGHGKGYYDEYLKKLIHLGVIPYTIGLSFKQQIVDDPLAVEGQDVKLDEILVA